jgi:hypothetical protein
MTDVDEELRARLREAAASHAPDRARILARVERGMAEETRPARRATRPPLSGWVRVATATAAVAGVLAAGGYTVASAVRSDAPPQGASSVSADPVPPPAASGHSPEASGRPSGRPSADEEDGPLWSDGSVDPHSNDFWAQSDITLKTKEQLTALSVVLRIRQTGGVRPTGAWRSLPETDFTSTVRERDGFLVYTWTLKQGRTVPAGEWIFAGQYDHDRGGRDARHDAYTATATAGGDGDNLAVAGDFAAHG